jgi:cytochrome b561
MMTCAGKRFTVLQRFLHWLIAICVLAMLFIGVGMTSSCSGLRANGMVRVAMLFIGVAEICAASRDT